LELLLALLAGLSLLTPCLSAGVGYAEAPLQLGGGDFALRDVFWASWSGPGAYNTLAVVLEYLADGEATSMTAELDVSPIWPGGGEISDYYDGPLYRGQRATFYFTFLVPTSARASCYNLTLEVDYEADGSHGVFETTVQVSVLGLPDLSVACYDDELTASSRNTVELRVSNDGGGVARLLRLEVVSQVPYVTVVGPSSFRKDLLLAGEEWEIQLDLLVASRAAGPALVLVALAYMDQFGGTYTYNTYLGFEIRGEGSLAISKVFYMPPLVFPGDKYVALTVILTNVGDYTAENITLELEAVEGLIRPSYAGAGEAKIPYLPVGYMANITFLVDVDEEAEPGSYEIPLDVQHDGLNYTLAIPFTIREKASFELSKRELSPKPSPGSKSIRVKLKLKNTSNVTAEHVRVSMISAYITGVTSVMIGDVGGGESRIAVLEVDFDETTPLSLEIDIQISWYQSGRPLTTTLTISLELEAPKKWPEAREVGIWLAFMAMGAALALSISKLRRGPF